MNDADEEAELWPSGEQVDGMGASQYSMLQDAQNI